MVHWKAWLKTNPLVRPLMMPWRLWTALSYYWPKLAGIPLWVLRSRENSNFTYDVTASSKECLADVVALAAGLDWQTVWDFIEEFEQEFGQLNSHCERVLASSVDRYTTDANAKPGRRLAYYALVRALKPRVVVEAGVARGLGTCIIDAALQRNASEGMPGIVHALDIETTAGCLIRKPYNHFSRLTIGDAEAFLKQLRVPVDLVFYDIVNASEMEHRQYSAIEDNLTDKAVVVSVWTTGALRKFAAKTGRRHITFRDEPAGHWHPGCRLAIAYCPDSEAGQATSTLEHAHERSSVC